MNKQDQELLDKQLRNLNVAPRNDGLMALAVVAVFLTGMTLGSFLYAYTDEAPPQPTRMAFNNPAPAHGSSQQLRQQ